LYQLLNKPLTENIAFLVQEKSTILYFPITEKAELIFMSWMQLVGCYQAYVVMDATMQFELRSFSRSISKIKVNDAIKTQKNNN
jgi:hypothetical protein